MTGLFMKFKNRPKMGYNMHKFAYYNPSGNVPILYFHENRKPKVI